MASRLADIFMREVVLRAEIGIDLHSAAIHRSNLPQIRLTPGNDRLAALGRAFGAPVMLNSKLREGSLRMAAEDAGIDVLLFEGGEGLRFDELAARSGVGGYPARDAGAWHGRAEGRAQSAHPHGDVQRVRAGSARPRAGFSAATARTGDAVEAGTVLGAVTDPFGEVEAEVICEEAGIVIGRTNMPVVYEGEALFHVASTLARAKSAADGVAAQMDAAPLFDEDEIL